MNAQIEDRQTTPMPPPPSADAVVAESKTAGGTCAPWNNFLGPLSPNPPSFAQIRRRTNRELTIAATSKSLTITITGQMFRDIKDCVNFQGVDLRGWVVGSIVSAIAGDMLEAKRYDRVECCYRAQGF